jgi:hypothetical protein
VQVVHLNYGTEQGFNSTGSFQLTGIQLSITPLYSNSKFIVHVTVAGTFQAPGAGSYANWQLYHVQSGTAVSGNNFAYATNYLSIADNYRGQNITNTFYVGHYDTVAAQTYQVYVNPVNSAVQINRDSGSTSTMTIIEIKQ